MNKTIFSMLSREPDEIIGENVFFNTSFDEQLDDWASLELDINNKPLFKGAEGYHAYFRIKDREDFSEYHKDYLLCPRKLNCYAWGKDPQLHNMLLKIANSGDLILDVASDIAMGFISVVVNYNSAAHCYASDLNEHCMKNLGECLAEYLPKYNINVIAFDNNDIPLKDNSLNYITSLYGMTSSSGDKNVITIAAQCRGQDKAVKEVYRILKPGGYFLTVEQFLDADFDLQKIYEYSQNYGRLFGIYTFNDVKAFVEFIREDSWQKNFTSAGFNIETEKEYARKLTVGEVKRLMFSYTSRTGKRCLNDVEVALNYLTKEVFEVIHTAHSSEEVLKSPVFLKEWEKTGAFDTNEKHYSKEVIAEILWKSAKSGEITECVEWPDDLRLNVYSGETIFVLRK